MTAGLEHSRSQLYCLKKISVLFEVFVKGFLILQPQHMPTISSMFPGLLLTPSVFTMGYTGLGNVLLQHLVPCCFLLNSSIFTQCLLNDSTEELVLLPPKKSFTVLYTNKHYFSFNIRLSESNLIKRQSPLIDACRCHGHHIKGQIRAGQTIRSGWKR